MALLSTIKCKQCHKTRSVSHRSRDGIPLICEDCESLNQDCKRTKHLDKLSLLTIDQRIKKIEEYIYDNHGKSDDVIDMFRMIG